MNEAQIKAIADAVGKPVSVVQALASAGLSPQQIVATISAQAAAPAQTAPAPAAQGNDFYAGLAGGFADAKDGNNNSRKLPDGRHLVTVQNVAMKSSHYGLKFVGDFIVDESPDADIGGTYSMSPKIGAEDMYGYGRNEAKGFLLRTALAEKFPGFVTGDKQQTQEALAWACSEAQPLRGTKLVAIVSRKTLDKTDNKGKPIVIVRHAFEPASSWMPQAAPTAPSPATPAVDPASLGGNLEQTLAALGINPT